MEPAGFWIGFGRWAGSAIGITVIAVVAIGGLVLGGWQASWWFANHDATRNYQLTQNGVSNQDTLRTRINGDFTTFNAEVVQAQAYPSLATGIKSQEDSDGNDICGLAPQVTTIQLPAQQAQWVAANCADGALSPSSPYYVATTPGITGDN
jgi:hypothetical protein